MKYYNQHFNIPQTNNEPLPAGVYPAVVQSIDLVMTEDYGSQVRITFFIPSSETHKSKLIYGRANKKFAPNCKLYQWTEAILGAVDEAYAFDPDDLIGEWCRLEVDSVTREVAVFNRIVQVLPYRDAHGSIKTATWIKGIELDSPEGDGVDMV